MLVIVDYMFKMCF